MRTIKFLLCFLMLFAAPDFLDAVNRRVVVLPPQFAGQKAAAIGSEDYQKLVGKNSQMSQAIVDGDKDFLEFQKKNDKILAEREEEIKKVVAERDTLATKRSFWRRLFGGSIFLTVLFGGGIVALFIFNPALAMTILRLFLTAIKLIGNLFGATLARLESALSHLKDFKASPKNVPEKAIVPVEPEKTVNKDTL